MGRGGQLVPYYDSWVADSHFAPQIILLSRTLYFKLLGKLCIATHFAPQHTLLNEFFANVLRDDMGSKKIQPPTSKKKKKKKKKNPPPPQKKKKKKKKKK